MLIFNVLILGTEHSIMRPILSVHPRDE